MDVFCGFVLRLLQLNSTAEASIPTIAMEKVIFLPNLPARKDSWQQPHVVDIGDNIYLVSIDAGPTRR